MGQKPCNYIQPEIAGSSQFVNVGGMIDNRRKQEEQSLEALMNEANLFVKHSMHQEGRVQPMLFIHGESGIARFRPKDFKNDRSKDEFASLAKLACIAAGADATVFVSEAWMKTPKQGEKLDLSRPPSSFPDRQEVAIMMGQTRTACQQRLLPMIRSKDGKFLGFGNEHRMNPDRMEGRFANFIPWGYPPPEVRAVAEAALDKLGVEIRKPEKAQARRTERGQGKAFEMGL